MRDTVKVTGFVLRADPSGEYDKRLVILSKERGKITAFAKGARRVHSSLLAACNPFVCAEFELIEGKNSYSLIKTDKAEYFEELSNTFPGVYYGFYALELAEAYGQENLQAGEMINLLYITLRAILKKNIPLNLIKCIYECRIMVLNGDFAMPADRGYDKAALYAIQFVIGAPLSNLYSFNLSENAMLDFNRIISSRINTIFGSRFKTLKVLASVDATTVD